MKLICWNMRRIGGGGKAGEISKWIKLHRIGFVGLIEMMCNNFRVVGFGDLMTLSGLSLNHRGGVVVFCVSGIAILFLMNQ